MTLKTEDEMGFLDSLSRRGGLSDKNTSFPPFTISPSLSSDNRKNLKMYFKYVYDCTKCGKKYGSDFKERKCFMCPFCLNSLRGYKKGTGR